MSIQTLEVEADSIERAREQVIPQIPSGFSIVNEKVIQSSDVVTVRAYADDSSSAFVKAMAKVPEGAEVIERKEIVAAEQKVLGIDAFTEAEARNGVKSDVVIQNVKLTSLGKKGFLGIGKRPNRYEVTVLRQAGVEIRYQRKLKMAFRLGDSTDKKKEETLGLTEALAGGWPKELARETFDRFDFDGFAAWVREFGSKAHPGTLPGFGGKPTYRLVNGKIGRESSPAEDCMIASTASRLSGRGSVSPFDDRASSLTMEIIQLYGGWNLAKFVFLLPFAERFAQKGGKKIILVEDAVIEVYKCVENMLFQIYDELREGQTFNDETVRQKLVSYVHRFARG
ncbi:MAG: hypothetical protein PHX83_04145 [Acidobacteriia bacterium]|nr:hypothetical protein [Terriglobia bacterium]